MAKLQILILLVTALSGVSIAQSPGQATPQPTPEIQRRVTAVLKLQPETALVELKKILTDARLAKDIVGEGLALNVMGFEYDQVDKTTMALENYLAALKIRLHVGDKLRLASTLSNIGLDYAAIGQDTEALSYDSRALTIYQELKISPSIANVQGNIGIVYGDLGQDSKGLIFEQLALKAYQGLNLQNGVFRMQCAIGLLYYDLGQNKKALEFEELALKTSLSFSTSKEVADAQFSLGTAYNDLGLNEKALNSYQIALATYKVLNLPVSVAGVESNMGIVFNDLGSEDAAFEYDSRALKVYQSLKLTKDVARVQGNIANVLTNRSKFQAALDLDRLALETYQALHRRKDAARIQANIGSLYIALGQRERGLSCERFALTVYQELSLPKDIAFVDGLLSKLYSDFRLPNEAFYYARRALKIYSDLDRPKDIARIEGGIGEIYHNEGKNEQALECEFLALKSDRELHLSQDAAWISYLVAEAECSMKRYDTALSYYEAALPEFQASEDALDESLVLAGTGRSLAAKGDRRLAIAAYKLAVGLVQAMRIEIKALDKDVRTSFKRKKADAYRELAQLLISEGRFSEAQHVIDLLKDDELNRFARAGRGEKVDLTQSEALCKEEFDALGTSLASDQAELAAVSNEVANVENPTEALKARLNAAESKIALHESKVKAWLDSARAIFEKSGIKDNPIVGIQESRGDLASTLASFPLPVAAVYTIVTNDGVRTLLTLPHVSGLKVGTTQRISSESLNRKIASFRTALTDPRSDPRPLGAELYDILIRPIQKELEKSHTQLIIWSLDGPLRYLPIAALYDRTTHQYVIEKYATSIFIPALRSRLVQEPKPIKRALGFGLTKAATVRDFHFNPLPGVRGELTRLRKTFGDLAQVYFDLQFTSASFRARLRGRPDLVHLGTHFQLRPGSGDASFMVLGDGTAFSATQFYELSTTKALSGVDLVVLSACDTATPIDSDADGAETESFARIALESGASAVIATLWPVDDSSTSSLMGKFYELRKAKPSIGKLEALRRAQLWLMSSNGLSGNQSRSAAMNKPEAGFTAYQTDPMHPFRHPYFWAPFILTGNTR